MICRILSQRLAVVFILFLDVVLLAATPSDCFTDRGSYRSLCASGLRVTTQRHPHCLPAVHSIQFL